MNSYAKVTEDGKFQFPQPYSKTLPDGRTVMVYKTDEELEADGYKKVYIHAQQRPQNALVPEYSYVDNGDIILGTMTWKTYPVSK